MKGDIRSLDYSSYVLGFRAFRCYRGQLRHRTLTDGILNPKVFGNVPGARPLNMDLNLDP